jgi:hypothetical protein
MKNNTYDLWQCVFVRVEINQNKLKCEFFSVNNFHQYTDFLRVVVVSKLQIYEIVTSFHLRRNLLLNNFWN